MWVKSDDTKSRSCLVNLDNVHCIERSCCRDCCSVNAYLNDGGDRCSGDGDLNEICLLEGTREECDHYFDWIYSELNARNDVVEYSGQVK